MDKSHIGLRKRMLPPRVPATVFANMAILTPFATFLLELPRVLCCGKFLLDFNEDPEILFCYTDDKWSVQLILSDITTEISASTALHACCLGNSDSATSFFFIQSGDKVYILKAVLQQNLQPSITVTRVYLPFSSTQIFAFAFQGPSEADFFTVSEGTVLRWSLGEKTPVQLFQFNSLAPTISFACCCHSSLKLFRRQHFLYINSDGHIIELFTTKISGLKQNNLTAEAGAEAASTKREICCGLINDCIVVYYISTSGNLCSLRWSKEKNWFYYRVRHNENFAYSGYGPAWLTSKVNNNPVDIILIENNKKFFAHHPSKRLPIFPLYRPEECHAPVRVAFMLCWANTGGNFDTSMAWLSLSGMYDSDGRLIEVVVVPSLETLEAERPFDVIVLSDTASDRRLISQAEISRLQAVLSRAPGGKGGLLCTHCVAEGRKTDNSCILSLIGLSSSVNLTSEKTSITYHAHTPEAKSIFLSEKFTSIGNGKAQVPRNNEKGRGWFSPAGTIVGALAPFPGSEQVKEIAQSDDGRSVLLYYESSKHRALWFTSFPDLKPNDRSREVMLQSIHFLSKGSINYPLTAKAEPNCEMEEITGLELTKLRNKLPQYFQTNHEDYCAKRIIEGKKPLTFILRSASKVINPVLNERFCKYQEKLRAEGRTEEELLERTAFHGTNLHNITNICKLGLLHVGHPNNPSQSTDEGYFGDPHYGIYVSRYLQYTLQYSNSCQPLEEGDTVKVIMFKVFLGKRFHVKELSVGIKPTQGYNCHDSPAFLEWYLFDEMQTCPIYVLEVQAVVDTRTAANDGITL